MEEGLKLKGCWRISEQDAQGNWKIVLEKKNLITNVGLNLVMSRLRDVADDPISHIAVGSGATGALATDTTLETEVTRKAIIDFDLIANVLNVEVTFGKTEGNFNWKEAGVFNDGGSGTMLNRLLIDYNKTSASAAKVEVEFTLT